MTDGNGSVIGSPADPSYEWRRKHLVWCVNCKDGRQVPVEFGILHTRDGLQLALQTDGQSEPTLVSFVAAPKLLEAIRQSISDLLTDTNYQRARA
ncbi:hypothetical protein [Amycolatopsis marina]|nr:hypothetical protein [Amycolatopsis marina]